MGLLAMEAPSRNDITDRDKSVNLRRKISYGFSPALNFLMVQEINGGDNEGSSDNRSRLPVSNKNTATTGHNRDRLDIKGTSNKYQFVTPA
jgi:hypothetical protein